MLQSLRVKNLAVVEEVRVDFDHGLNVITGETGAGKSVIMGALGLVLGERADRSLIRSGADQAAVDATFVLADSGAVDAVLDELGLDPCPDGLLVIRRQLTASGGGRVVVNDAAATVQALKRLGDCLVDMHGPHDHQSLLSADFQLDLLDAFGHLWKLRSPYEDAHRAVREIEERRAALEGDEGETESQIELLTFQVNEIEQAGLDGETEETLVQEHATAANAQQVLELAAGVTQALTEGEGNAFDALAAARRLLGGLDGLLPEAAEWEREAESAAVQVQELAAAISARAAGVEGDPERLQWLEDRLGLLHRLKRKYGGDVPAILAARDRAAARLEELRTRHERLERLDADLAQACAERTRCGGALRERRQAAAGKLAKAVTEHLRALGFAHGAFSVEVEPAPEALASGLDRISFGFAPNAGEPMRPLRAIASSGEISRVMLACKAVLAAHDRIPVLVFDEIDANLGGEMGNAVGEKLAAVAAHHQVLCITHLPQVAAHGRQHFVVAKEVRAGRTYTAIRPAEGQAREEEIARMLGGRDLTSVTLRHARELLERCGA